MIKYTRVGKYVYFVVELCIFKFVLSFIGIKKFCIRFDIGWGWEKRERREK